MTVVGKVDRPSPTLTTQITAVNLNPTGAAVDLKKTSSPKCARTRAMSTDAVLDGNGNEVDARSVDWHSDRTPNFTVRQDWVTERARQCAHRHAEPHSVYMHDTNYVSARTSFSPG
jgi:murein L,D-transpeptidase YcbB/YkuD